MGDSGGGEKSGREEGREMRGGWVCTVVLGVREPEYKPRGVVIALVAALSGGERREVRREREDRGVNDGCGG